MFVFKDIWKWVFFRIEYCGWIICGYGLIMVEKKFWKIVRCLRCIDIIKIDFVCCNFRNWEVVYNLLEGNFERESYRKKRLILLDDR